MPRQTKALLLHILLGTVCLFAAQITLPSETALWRRSVAYILAITLGQHMARSILSTESRIIRAQMWLECAAFPIVVYAFLKLPSWKGWVLFFLGFVWRSLVGRLFVVNNTDEK